MKFKNFRGQQEDKKKEQKPILVKDYMAKKLITFKPNQNVLEVMQILVKNKISGGPIVNKKNELLGLISEGDCMKEISESQYYNVPMAEHRIKKFMVTEVETVNDDVTIFDVAGKFYKTHRKRFPVISNGKLVGQISRRDVLKAVLEFQE